MQMMRAVAVLGTLATWWWTHGATLQGQAAADSTNGSRDDSAKVKLSGYVTASYTYSTRRTGNQIVGRLYDRFQDQIELNAGKVALEKPVATDKWDAGARVDLLFGQDATVIKAAGLMGPGSALREPVRSVA